MLDAFLRPSFRPSDDSANPRWAEEMDLRESENQLGTDWLTWVLLVRISPERTNTCVVID